MNAELAGGGASLRNTVDRVVVAQGQELHPGGHGDRNHFPRGEGAVGVVRVALEVERWGDCYKSCGVWANPKTKELRRR